MKKVEKEFECIAKFINESRNAAIGLMNHASLSTYWTVGAYVSLRTKSGSWGDRTVDALCDYLKTRHPKLRGFSRRQTIPGWQPASHVHDAICNPHCLIL